MNKIYYLINLTLCWYYFKSIKRCTVTSEIFFPDVIRKSHIDATDDQISAPIKIWLTHAKERLMRQNQNQENEENKENEEEIQD